MEDYQEGANTEEPDVAAARIAGLGVVAADRAAGPECVPVGARGFRLGSLCYTFWVYACAVCTVGNAKAYDVKALRRSFVDAENRP